MLKFIFILISFLSFLTISAQQITNIQVTQESDKVVIKYNITSDKAGQTFDIKVECSADGGKTFSINPQSLTGDLTSVSTGIGKRIVWDVLSERETLSGDHFVFQLLATVNNPTDSYSGNSGTFADTRDGHVYKWVRIGTQIWMAENLAYLPWVNLPLEGSKSTPRYYVYDYNGINKEIAKAMPNFKTYGVLYNWAAAKVACPEGWHLPNNSEWNEMIKLLGGQLIAGNKMKSFDDWNKLSKKTTNESGFTGPPGGLRGSGGFGAIGFAGHWWSYSEPNDLPEDAWIYNLMSFDGNVGILTYSKQNGLSVRCVKD